MLTMFLSVFFRLPSLLLAPQGDDLHHHETHWPAPEPMHVDSHTALIWTQTAEVKWHREPLSFSKMNTALTLIPSSCCSIWEPINNELVMQNNSAVALRDPVPVHKGGKKFLLQVRLIPGYRNTNFLPASLSMRQQEFYQCIPWEQNFTLPDQGDFSHKRQRGQLISTCKCPP